DEFQLSQIKHQFLECPPQNRRQLPLELRRGGSVEAAREADRDHAGMRGADVLLNLNLEWHIDLCLVSVVSFRLESQLLPAFAANRLLKRRIFWPASLL